MLSHAARAKAEHQGRMVCEGPMRAGRIGSVAVSLLRELGILCSGFSSAHKRQL